ncbi:hypothetical protein S83_055226, partial [Arachis hypogaea]
VLATAVVVGLVARICGQVGPAAIVIGSGLTLSLTAVVLQKPFAKEVTSYYNKFRAVNGDALYDVLKVHFPILLHLHTSLICFSNISYLLFLGWAFDILGWGFSDLAEKLTSCDVVSKHEHFYQFCKSYIKRPMILVRPSLGSTVAIDFAVNYPEVVEKLVLIDASIYTEGTGNLATLPRLIATLPYILQQKIVRLTKV